MSQADASSHPAWCARNDPDWPDCPDWHRSQDFNATNGDYAHEFAVQVRGTPGEEIARLKIVDAITKETVLHIHFDGAELAAFKAIIDKAHDIIQGSK